MAGLGAKGGRVDVERGGANVTVDDADGLVCEPGRRWQEWLVGCWEKAQWKGYSICGKNPLRKGRSEGAPQEVFATEGLEVASARGTEDSVALLLYLLLLHIPFILVILDFLLLCAKPIHAGLEQALLGIDSGGFVPGRDAMEGIISDVDMICSQGRKCLHGHRAM